MLSVKASGLQRSRSDAGRDFRKPPSGLAKPSYSSYRKTPPSTGTATVITAGGATLSSGSSTLGKIPRSSGIPVKPLAGGGEGWRGGGGEGWRGGGEEEGRGGGEEEERGGGEEGGERWGEEGGR